MSNKKIILVIAFSAFAYLSGYSQSDTTRLLNIVSRLDTVTTNHPIEKVYLHLDKPYYFPGDTLRFKAYVTVTDKHKLSALSGILYTDLVGPGAKLVKSIKMQIIGGTAVGDFALADSLVGGTYRVRAYTNWMRNNAATYFFDRPVNISEKISGQVLVHTVFKETPEINGMQRHALITYTDKYGRPYVNKQVSYAIKAGGKSGAAQIGNTNDKGVLDVLLPAYKTNSADNGQLVTHLKIYGTRLVDKTIPIKENAKNDIQFFPESGHQVIGLRSKIAFKAVGVDGLGRHVKGTVVDEAGQDVAYFESQHLGMGVFAMTPLAGKTYHAKIIDDDGSESTVSLPVAQREGFVLAVDNSDSSKLIVRVMANAETFEQKKNTTFFLVGQCGGKAYYTTFGKLDNPVFVATVWKTKFPSGIMQFTLFSSSGEVINERVVFISNNDQLDLDIKTAGTKYAPREKVKMDIMANDKDAHPVIGSFSVAVINESVVSSNQNAESSILSYLLLTSDLHGYIEEPGYYFDHTAQSAVKDLDILMLSQGYRRFEWKQILDGHYPLSAFQPEQGINLSGIVETQSGKPVVRGKISIYSPKTNTFLDTLTNDQGKFNFDDINFPDTTKLVIQARKANDGKNVNISLNPTPAPPLNNDPVNDIAPDNIYANVASDNTELQADMALSKTDTLAAPKKLKEVRIKEKKTVKPTEYNGYGSVYQYDANMKVFEGYNSLFDALTRIPGVFLSGGRLLVYDDKPLAVIVDGREMDVIEGQGALRLMAVEDVESVSIVDARQPLVIITTKERAHTDVVKLKDLNITSSRKNTIKFSSNLNGPGNADQVIFGDRLEGCANLLDCLKARLFGISFKDGNFYALRNQSHINYASQGAPTYMIVIVDGGQLSADMLNAYSSDDVNSVEVLTSISHLSLYGSNAPGGVIIVNTKRGSDTDDSYKYKSVPGVIYYSFKGFYQAREFYSPKYDHPQTATDPVDGRTTIYWNPNVNTDKSGKASVEFYNGDGKGLYRTIIEGIDADGNMGHKVYWYKVE